MLEAYDAVMAIILPTLGPDRRATYSPFLPISPDTGKVLQVPIEKRDLAAGTITYRAPDTGKTVENAGHGRACEVPVEGGLAMRWTALGIDYEMAGKDLIDSVAPSSKICRALGGRPPEGFNYELFLDDKGQKISKSKGNGIAVEEWLALRSGKRILSRICATGSRRFTRCCSARARGRVSALSLRRMASRRRES